MRSNFFKDKNLTCVIICGGRGTRIFPLTKDIQKSMLKVVSKPLLGFVIDYWKQFTNNFIFIAAFKKEDVFNYVKTLDINYKFIYENEPKGIANALYLAKDMCSDNFIFVLGDCICKGNFKFPEKFSQGIGVWKTQNEEDIKRSYAIKIGVNKFITFVEEKPMELFNDLCGMGFYFFNKTVFDYIKKTEPSKRTGKVEITDVIKNMVNSGLEISPIFFEGDYLNVTYPGDLKKAEQILFS